MIIKVCGMREPENIRAVEAAAPDWVGFIFWTGSKRYVATVPDYLPKLPIKRVGVFVDAALDEILQRVRSFQLDLIQLHGAEAPEYCAKVKAATGLPIIKAFSIADQNDLRLSLRYSGLADYFLFDTKSRLPGGNGESFDWRVLDAYTSDTPFLLSGGISPADLPRFAAYDHPHCVGIDLNSRFETAPAVKDVKTLQPFIAGLRKL